MKKSLLSYIRMHYIQMIADLGNEVAATFAFKTSTALFEDQSFRMCMTGLCIDRFRGYAARGYLCAGKVPAKHFLIGDSRSQMQWQVVTGPSDRALEEIKTPILIANSLQPRLPRDGAGSDFQTWRFAWQTCAKGLQPLQVGRPHQCCIARSGDASIRDADL